MTTCNKNNQPSQHCEYNSSPKSPPNAPKSAVPKYRLPLEPPPPPPPVRPAPKGHIHHLHDDKLHDVLLDQGPGLLLAVPGQGVPAEDPGAGDEQHDDAARGEDARAARRDGVQQHGLGDGQRPVVGRLPQAQDEGVGIGVCAGDVLAWAGDGDCQRQGGALRGDVPVQDGGAAEEYGREDAVG